MQIINDVQQRPIGKNCSEKSTQAQSGLFSQMMQRHSKAMSKTKETAGNGLETLERSEISLSYPPSTECKGMEALTTEVIAELRGKYDFQNMGQNSKEFKDFIAELKRLEIISEKDAQDMLLGEPMSFDEKGRPTSWLNYVGKSSDGEENGTGEDNAYGGNMNLDEVILQWLKELAETGKINFADLKEKGEGDSGIARLYQKKAAVCEKVSDIIQKILAE